jgi:ribonuclease HII
MSEADSAAGAPGETPPRPEPPTDRYERRAKRKGATLVAGVDEAGRGPLAGPVVAAAVIFETRRYPDGIDDSKRLTVLARQRLYDQIIQKAIVSVCVASRARIDRMNILRASLWAMSRAIRGLARPPDHVIVDGNMLPPDVACRCEAIVDGDALSISVAAASIVAKVTRDRLMANVGKAFPAYGFESHVGYSTPEHFAALREHGPCPHHRRSFAPVMAQQLELGLLDAGFVAADEAAAA